MQDPHPSRTLAIILGASTFPESPELLQGRFFHDSAADFEDYLADPNGLGLPPRNIFSLFNDSRSPSEQIVKIGEFLNRRDLELRSAGSRADDLIVYYVGHGLFRSGADQAYCLALRSTNEMDAGETSMRAAGLANIIRARAAFLRRYLILDCCFAASIYKEFQAGPLAAAHVQIRKEFPQRGTAVMCSSNAYEPARAPQGLGRTMFTSALVNALRSGYDNGEAQISFSELGDLVSDNLRKAFPATWVRPEVHSPDQHEGNIAHLPLFPNPAYVPRRRKTAAAIRDQAHPPNLTGSLDVEAPPVERRQRAGKKDGVQKTAGNGASKSKQKEQVFVRSAKSEQPGKKMSGKPTQSERMRKPAERDRGRRKEIDAQTEALRLFKEWRKLEQAEELKRRKIAKQRAAEREARKAAEAERKRQERLAAEKREQLAEQRAAEREGRKAAEAECKRKERLAAQNAAAERVLERIRRERAQALGRTREVSPAPRRDTQAALKRRRVDANRTPPKGEAAQRRKKERRAAQSAAADRVLESIRRDRQQQAERKRRAVERERERDEAERALLAETEVETDASGLSGDDDDSTDPNNGKVENPFDSRSWLSRFLNPQR